jgi:multiple sugar transport system ATP-binding protein
LVGGAVELGAHRVALPDAIRRVLRRDAGDVLVGLRPEEFEDAALHRDGGRAIVPAEVEITEQLGPETLAYVRVEGIEVIEIGERPVELAGALSARLDPRTTAAPGQRIELAINPEGVHVFDLESGESLVGT